MFFLLYDFPPTLVPGLVVPQFPPTPPKFVFSRTLLFAEFLLSPLFSSLNNCGPQLLCYIFHFPPFTPPFFAPHLAAAFRPISCKRFFFPTLYHFSVPTIVVSTSPPLPPCNPIPAPPPPSIERFRILSIPPQIPSISDVRFDVVAKPSFQVLHIFFQPLLSPLFESPRSLFQCGMFLGFFGLPVSFSLCFTGFPTLILVGPWVMVSFPPPPRQLSTLVPPLIRMLSFPPNFLPEKVGCLILPIAFFPFETDPPLSTPLHSWSTLFLESSAPSVPPPPDFLCTRFDRRGKTLAGNHFFQASYTTLFAGFPLGLDTNPF